MIKAEENNEGGDDLPKLPWNLYILVVGASHSRLHRSS